VNNVEDAKPPHVFNEDSGAPINNGVNTGYGSDIPMLASNVTAKATHNFLESENILVT
jgi:hypothetical protein